MQISHTDADRMRLWNGSGNLSQHLRCLEGLSSGAHGHCDSLRDTYRRIAAANASFSAYESFIHAMACYEEAIELAPPGNDDAILRWNTCARILMRNQNLRAQQPEAYEPVNGE